MSFSDDLKTGVTPYRQRFHDVLLFLRGYFKNPVQAMRSLPDWDWPTLFLFYSATAAICGTLSGILARKITLILAGIIFFPVAAIFGAAILTGLLYYTYTLFFHREVAPKTLFTIVALSLLPFFALYIFSGIVEPIKLVGFAVFGILLTVGLTEHTNVDRRQIIKLVTALYVVYFLFWMVNIISWRNKTKQYKELAAPESHDILKKEFE